MSVRREQANAVEMQNLVGIGSYKTVLSVIRKIKPMIYCTSPKRLSWTDNKLKGIVEISKKILSNNIDKYIFIAVETNNGIIGRVRIVEYPEYKNEQRFYKAFVSQLIDKNATIRYESQQISCPLAKKVGYDFDDWRKGRENIELNKLCPAYCRMINTYKTPVTFDEILRNILSGNPPPRHDSSLI